MVNFKRNDVRRTILVITNNIPILNLDPEAVAVVCSRLPLLHRTTTDAILHLARLLGLESGDEHVRSPATFLRSSFRILFSAFFFIFIRCVFIGRLGLLVCDDKEEYGEVRCKKEGQKRVHRG